MKGLKHSNLASYDNIFVKDGQAHLFMELSTGGNLKEKIDLKGRIS